MLGRIVAVRHLLMLTMMALWAALCSPALAQNNAARADAGWLEQVSGLLDRQHDYPGFETDRAYEDWIIALERRFTGSHKASNTYRLEAGESYLIVGACDADCADLDLQAFDSTGASVAIDRAVDDKPVLRVTPITTDDFRVDVWWVSCRATPCYSGVRVLRQTGSTMRRAGAASSHGTGFFVTDDGYIVTNHHVIAGGRNVEIEYNGEVYPAEIVEADSVNDLAVLKANVIGRPLIISSSLELQRGSEIFTLGYPLVSIQGSEQKAAFGRVNALSGISDDRRYLQIDAPIQPGNSGGPLIDEQGRVVGIVTATLNQSVAIRSSGHIAQNVNYAIKADYLIPLLPAAARTPRTAETTATMVEAVSRAEQSVVLVRVR